MMEFFRETGKVGGKKAAANMTPEQRSERAKKAVAARESKRAAEKPAPKGRGKKGK